MEWDFSFPLVWVYLVPSVLLLCCFFNVPIFFNASPTKLTDPYNNPVRQLKIPGAWACWKGSNWKTSGEFMTDVSFESYCLQLTFLATTLYQFELPADQENKIPHRLLTSGLIARIFSIKKTRIWGVVASCGASLKNKHTPKGWNFRIKRSIFS